MQLLKKSINLYLSLNHKKQYALFYLLCFVLSFCWYFYYGLILSKVNPILFVNRLDFTRNILMLTNLQGLLIKYYWLRLLFDITYFLLPFLLTYSVLKDKLYCKWIVVFTILFNMCYGIFIASFTYISLDLYIAWFYVPFVFYPSTTKGFYFSFHSVRFIFLLIFFTAGVWKIRTGAIFNIEQMSGILLLQHKQYLAGNPDNWFSHFIYFLVTHSYYSYALYLLGTIAELVFIIGFFTKKMDKWLLIAFLLFFISDYFLMRINYSNWMVFAGLLYFSKFKKEKYGI